MNGKRFFTSESTHGSSSSYGFANDTIVLVFSSAKTRDKYVRESDNISCKAIPASRATREATNWSLTRNEDNKPQPFTGEYWGIVAPDTEAYDYEPIDGLIGQLEVCDGDGEYTSGERFYR